MYPISDNVRQDLVTLVPASIVNEISCFVFYDHHPRENNNIDIVVCTALSEVKEFYQRECVYSTVLDTSSNFVEIRILRNPKCQLFYLIATKSEVFVLSRKDRLEVMHHIENVSSYVIDDSLCWGKPCLKIVRIGDPEPLNFDDEFVNLGLKAEMLNILRVDSTLPVMTDLATKLTQSSFDMKNKEKFYKDMMSMRQQTAYSYYQKVSPNSAKAVFRELENSNVRLVIKNPKPWVRISNKNIVAIFELLNKDTVPIEDVYILLHNPSSSSMVYTTKLFHKIPTSPFWEANNSNKINKGCTAVVLVIDMKELNYNITKGIQLNCIIIYKIQNTEQYLSIENICLSASDVMGEHFDILYRIQTKDEDNYNILALIATSEKTEMFIRHIKRDSDPDIDLLDVLCGNLNMERMTEAHNIVVHKKSPYHILHGVLIIKDSREYEAHRWKISLYTRSPPQILAFIHNLHDAVPFRLLATTTNQIIESRDDFLSTYDEEPDRTADKNSHLGLKTSILKQTATLVEYLDECMVKMNNSGNPVVLNKIGTEVDIFAGGQLSYIEFRNKLLQEASKGFKDGDEEEVTTVEFQGTDVVIELD